MSLRPYRICGRCGNPGARTPSPNYYDGMWVHSYCLTNAEKNARRRRKAARKRLNDAR